jgi:hypothetical protein
METIHSATLIGKDNDGDHAPSNARQMLLDWNFDPDDVTQLTCDWYSSPMLDKHLDTIPYSERLSRAMILMAHLNELPTMIYILKQAQKQQQQQQQQQQQGGSLSATATTTSIARDVLTQTDDFGLFPLYTAISEPNDEEQVLKTVQWLVHHGAKVNQSVHGMYNAFRRACFKGYGKVAKWLVMEGGTFLLTRNNNHENNNSEITFCHFSAKRYMQPLRLSYDTAGCTWTAAAHADDVHQQLFQWAETTLATRRNFAVFMLAAAAAPTNGSNRQGGQKKHDFFQSLSSSLQVWNGHTYPGILEHIAGFVGVETKKKVLTTARGLLEHKVWYQVADMKCFETMM